MGAEGFWWENPSGSFLGGDVASSRPSILLRGVGAVAHLFLGGGQRLTAFLSLPPMAPPSSWHPSLLGLPARAGKLILFAHVEVGSRGRAWPPARRRVPGTSMSSAGLRGALGGPPLLCRGCRCLVRLVVAGQMGGPSVVLCLGLECLLGGPTSGGPTLTASGEPHVPLLRHLFYVIVTCFCHLIISF